MVKFTNLRFKNFLSYGNYFTEIQLDRHRSTLIVGHNGAGKSTMLDAISFALFGSPHRAIKKNQLVNSINNKNCVVEVEFVVGSHEFKIVRGIKPTSFEIWQNGTMINQASTARDYQKYLEQNILKLNHKSFHQIVVLGSSSFIPFMQLKQKDRREVIEDLLDIGIFSKMNTLLKEKQSAIVEQTRQLDYEVEKTKDAIEFQKRYIRDMSSVNEEQRAVLMKQIDDAAAKMKELEADNEVLQKDVDDKLTPLNTEHTKLSQEREQLLRYESQFKSKASTIVKDMKFYEDNDNCPTCSQIIDSGLKDQKLKESREKAKELQDAMTAVAVKTNQVNKRIEEIVGSINKIQESSMHINANNREISTIQSHMNSWNKQLSSLDKTGDLSAANTDLNNLNDTLHLQTEKRGELVDISMYNRVAQELLKDTGIKTKIVKEYIPVINKLVNSYLQILDFFVSFNLDENFDESIKSRYRDEFKYASFSEGEKQRIDLSLMFTWRQIAKMKNSTATNLLILDETFDSSLDEGGIENLFKILDSIDNDSNVFIISHKGEILEDKFPNKIEFYKDKNFSKMKG